MRQYSRDLICLLEHGFDEPGLREHGHSGPPSETMNKAASSATRSSGVSGSVTGSDSPVPRRGRAARRRRPGRRSVRRRRPAYRTGVHGRMVSTRAAPRRVLRDLPSPGSGPDRKSVEKRLRTRFAGVPISNSIPLLPSWMSRVRVSSPALAQFRLAHIQYVDDVVTDHRLYGGAGAPGWG